MGVPAFFRWLSQKYPSIVAHCVEKRGPVISDDGKRAPIDATEPNPNGEEFDNLYLDMNGIIHPCTHPENKLAPQTEAEMFVDIFEYIDRLFDLIRPRRILYMAIDGVAPRAKMNQQRSRRFRASKESHDKQLTIERLRAELEAKGAKLPPPKSGSEHFDSNCITPGTPFMDRLAIALQYYVYDRLNNHPAWKKIQVILSDSNAPGEGEHKIMDFIRRQRQSPTHDPNTRHCLCGADADLIILGLATHEPYFTIIREEFKPNQPRPCELCGQCGHEMDDCVGAPSEASGVPPPPGSDVEFIFIKLAVLRQYLEDDLQIPSLPFEWDLERAIDDWVLMCFFVGNDFLPHLPSLEIREGAIDRLISLYKSVVCDVGGWLTDSGRVHLDRVQLIMTELGKVEDEIFRKRRDDELFFRERRRRGQNLGGRQSWPNTHGPPSGVFSPTPLGGGRRSGTAPITAEQVRQDRRQQQQQPHVNVNWVEQCLQNQEAAVSLRVMLKSSTSTSESSGRKRKSSDSEVASAAGDADYQPSAAKRIKGRLGGVDGTAIKEKVKNGGDQMDEDERADTFDEVRLWEDGWRSRYYQSKFGVDPSDASEFCIKVAHEYVKGICWVLAYYYQGCASWGWYYPYHYAPFASDFVNVAAAEPQFHLKRTKPFCPLEQLMGVFPAASRFHVPPAWQDLMTDHDSPIIDFYPTDFKIDLNGKRYLWMGVALLPFVDEVRLLQALDDRRSKLTDEERFRNLRRPELYFVHADTAMGQFVVSLYNMEEDGEKPLADAGVAKSVARGLREDYTGSAPSSASLINAAFTEGIAGHVWPDFDNACLPGHRMASGVKERLPDIPAVKQRAVSVFFENPEYPFGHVFPARLLDSVKMPLKGQLLPPATRGRGRGRGGNSNFRNNRDGGRGFQSGDAHENSAWQQNSPADRMIRHNLPPPHYDPYGQQSHHQQQHHRQHYSTQQGGYSRDQHRPPLLPPASFNPYPNPYAQPPGEPQWRPRGPRPNNGGGYHRGGRGDGGGGRGYGGWQGRNYRY